MPQTITLTYDCQQDDCDGKASVSTLYLNMDASNGEPIELEIDELISQVTLECDECGTSYYTGDADDFILTDAGE